jgi:hypothetical protein
MASTSEAGEFADPACGLLDIDLREAVLRHREGRGSVSPQTGSDRTPAIAQLPQHDERAAGQV